MNQPRALKTPVKPRSFFGDYMLVPEMVSGFMPRVNAVNKSVATAWVTGFWTFAEDVAYNIDDHWETQDA